MNTIVAPAKMPGRIKGSVIRVNRRHPLAPSVSAASLSAGSRFAKAAVVFRKMIG